MDFESCWIDRYSQGKSLVDSNKEAFRNRWGMFLATRARDEILQNVPLPHCFYDPETSMFRKNNHYCRNFRSLDRVVATFLTMAGSFCEPTSSMGMLLVVSRPSFVVVVVAVVVFVVRTRYPQSEKARWRNGPTLFNSTDAIPVTAIMGSSSPPSM